MTVYRRLDDDNAKLKPGDVVHWKWEADGEKGNELHFKCPCEFRMVKVTQPPHTITFGEDGILQSLGGSCGYAAQGDRPENWCHFTITDGVAAMHDDAKCPGKEMT